ncbi:ATP-grasp domain protein [Rippkaea orientalis PCC 8801]|uniref:ATP-grasp domain protein n=1 Tax=Rippkaea orientalis (strain PCC 8801 / RF-1) TaxID=41431 RepID=B7JVP6_RIPO1|nr:ATP-grasp domain-containing protein [Rippkaea orientalis]ACK64617.1 ATP-grasp domain protein [Rippkaea orientalis PCC 8801]
MDLLEYQAKELFHRVGIPILPSQPIANLSEIKRLQIPYPVVLKSQVRSGGRGKAGGIRFVENTIDAIAAAQAIFSLPILGEYPEVILAEARYNTQAEFFLCVLFDYQLQCPVLLGSSQGGIEVENLLSHIEKVVLDGEFSPFYARRLAIKMGLEGKLIHAVSSIIEKMYQLFREKDLDWIEINPLAVSPTGEVMALDGKIAVNDSALPRHQDLLDLLTSQQSKASSMTLTSGKAEPWPPILQHLRSTSSKGEVGIISNSWGLALTTWDLLVKQKGKPDCAFVMLEKKPEKSIIEQFSLALAQAMQLTHLQVILINILGSPETAEAIAQAIADYYEPYSKQKNEDRLPRPTGANTSERQGRRQNQTRSLSVTEPLPLVVRLVGGDIDAIKQHLSGLTIYWQEDLETAITQTLLSTSAKQ